MLYFFFILGVSFLLFIELQGILCVAYGIGDIMTGVACGAGKAYPSGTPDCTSGFYSGSCCLVICFFLFHVIVFSFGYLV